MSPLFVKCPNFILGRAVISIVNTVMLKRSFPYLCTASVPQLDSSRYEPWAAVKDGDGQWSGSEESRWYQI